MGSLLAVFSGRSTQPEFYQECPAIETDLQESVISHPDWETRSWLDYSFRQAVSSVPSSLGNSWVNLDFIGSTHLLQSTTPQESREQSPACESRDSERADSLEASGESGTSEGGQGLVTCIGEEETSMALSEFAVQTPAVCKPTDEASSRDVFQDLSSLQRTPVHNSLRRFQTNRSWTFSGAGNDFTSPSRHSLHSRNSLVSMNRTASPQCVEGPLTTSLCVPNRDTEKGMFISGLFQTHFTALIDQIHPQDVARHLYNLAILTTPELERACNHHLDKGDRAQAIVLCLQKKLRYKPELFSDVCAALKKAGVVVVEKIKVEVRSRYPEDNDLTRSMSVLSSRLTPELFNCGTSPSVCSGPDSSISSRSSGHLEHVVTSLEQAFRDGRLSAAKDIISRETAKQNGVSLLYEACRLEVNVGVLNLLLTETTLDVNISGQHGRSPLHVTCASLSQTVSSQQDLQECQDQLKQQRMKIENLLKHGADSSAKDQDGNTALHLATLRRDCETVGILVRHSPACIDLTNRLGNTALHIACREGHTEVVQLLCAHGANTVLHNVTRKESTPMLMAVSHEHVGAAQTIMDHDSSSLDGTDSRKRSPLHMSTKRRNSTLTETLCDHCEPYQLDVENKTPLHYACYWGSLDLVTPLLNRDSSRSFINAQDRNGDTALHIASRRGHKGVIKLLMAKSAAKDVKNQEGKTPVDLARQWEHKKAVKLLSKKSPWLKRRRRRSSGAASLKRVDTQSSLTSESSVDAQMVLSSAESECDETINPQY